MTGNEILPPAILQRKAVVYVRQSTQAQVEANAEGRRRQYELVDVARRRGFRTVEVIDDDLGRSASGMVARPGFEKLIAALCAGEIGAVLCFDASRLARNGRDWHHLLELCGLVEARVIDLDGVYDPCRPNDRLLLGMKGSISEFELGVIRARMLDAARAKARRGELRIGVPIGYVWHREIGLGFDPDIRLQQAIRRVFERFRQLGSARQAGASLAGGGRSVLSAALRRQTADILRLDADPLPQRDRALEEPFLRRRIRLWQKREADRDGRRAGAQVLRPRQGCRGLGRADPWAASRRLHRLVGVRAESGAARGQYLWAGWWTEVRPGWPGIAGRAAYLRSLRPRAGGSLHRCAARSPDLWLRPAQSHARSAALPRLWRLARGRL